MFEKKFLSNNETTDPEIVQRFSKKLEQEPSLEFINQLFKKLPELEMYLVGGMVRDTLLKRPTSKDYDFIARMIGLDKLIQILGEYGKVDLVGRNFGVIKFWPKGSNLKEAVDIALPRKEFAMGTGGYRDFEAQADETLAVEEDLSRRDLTINAIAWDVKNKKIIDPFEGQSDLEKGVIRCVGSPGDRFQEDYSRMLRAIRFACRFNFEIEAQTWQAMVNLMPHINDKRKNETGKMERVVPMETVTKEMFKALQKNPIKALELFNASGAFEHILPETTAQLQNRQTTDRLTAKLEQLESAEFRQEFPRVHRKPAFVFALILDQLVYDEKNVNQSKNNLIAICRRFMLTKKDLELINKIIDHKHQAKKAGRLSTVQTEKLFWDETGTELKIMLYLESIKNDGLPENNFYSKIKAQIQTLEALQDEAGDLPPELLDGNEIMAVLNLKKGGKIIKDAKTALREEQLNGRIVTKEQAKQFVKNKFI